MSAVLVDTNIWIGHFKQSNPLLMSLLEDGEIVCHPVIIGELSMGNLVNRKQTLLDLSTLSRPPIANFHETRQMVEGRKLWGRGIQWNDALILASSILGEVRLWTQDTRLKQIASEIGVDYDG